MPRPLLLFEAGLLAEGAALEGAFEEGPELEGPDGVELPRVCPDATAAEEVSCSPLPRRASATSSIRGETERFTMGERPSGRGGYQRGACVGGSEREVSCSAPRESSGILVEHMLGWYSRERIREKHEGMGLEVLPDSDALRCPEVWLELFPSLAHAPRVLSPAAR